MGEKVPDFFISHTQADRAWAEWIAWQLDNAGQRTVLQAWDFGPGSDWVHQMHHATATAKRTIAVLSRSYLQSVHGRRSGEQPTPKIPQRVACVGAGAG